LKDFPFPNLETEESKMQKIFSGEVVLIGKRKLIAKDTQTKSNMFLALTHES
jgi:hypothetical protein